MLYPPLASPESKLHYGDSSGARPDAKRHSNKLKLLLWHILTTIVILTIANSSWGFNVNKNTTLDKDYHEAFAFTASNTTLNCAGHSIIGTGNGSGDGLTLKKIQLATVINCWITNFDRGVLLDGTTDSVFDNNIVYDNVGGEGIHLQNQSNKNVFTRNSVFRNNRDGFDLDKSDGNAFLFNALEFNGQNGIELDDSNYNGVGGNIIYRNDHTGVSLDVSTRNIIDKNDISQNNYYGIHFGKSSTDNLLLYNTVCGNIPGQLDISKSSRDGILLIQNIVQDVCP